MENKPFTANMNTAEINTAEKIAEEKKRQEKLKKSKEKKKKYLSIALSVLVAVGLWIYVMNNENPTQTKIYYDIPIEYLNSDVLEDKGMVVSEAETEVIRVELQGKRSSLMSIKKTDIAASVDVSSYSEGDNYVDVTVHVPSSVSVSEVNPAQIRIRIENIITEDRDVSVVFEGSVADRREAVCLDMSTEIVSISGARSAVNTVNRLEANIPVTSLSNESVQIAASLTPVDANGNKVDNITVSVSEITVTAQMYNVKTVKLNTETVGSLPDSLELASLDAPESILIAGPADEINSITEVSTQPVDLSEITSSAEVELIPDLSGNIRLASSQKSLTATITVRKKSYQELNYSVEAIEILNAEERTVTFDSETVSIDITGTESSIAGVSSADFTLSIDCAELAAGSHTVNVTVTLSEAAKEAGISVTEPSVSINIE